MDVRTYLAQASPEEWHQVARSWNWDNGNEELLWIIRQPTPPLGVHSKQTEKPANLIGGPTSGGIPATRESRT
jgi:hypothetical protein